VGTGNGSLVVIGVGEYNSSEGSEGKYKRQHFFMSSSIARYTAGIRKERATFQ